MMFEERQNLIDCCILIADCIVPSPDYEKTGGVYKFSYTYSVPKEKIEEAQKFIATTFEHFKLPCSRVYISGFAILTRNSIWNKERIVEQIQRETEKINMILHDISNVKTK